MKAYTDLGQSKKLAEILPLESADMVYIALMGNTTYPDVLKVNLTNKHWNEMYPDVYIPCWSLAALLGVLPKIQGGKPIIALDDNYITYPHMSNLHTKADNPIDACYEVIIKLYELKML